MNFNINFQTDLHIDNDSKPSAMISQIENTPQNISKCITDNFLQEVIPWKMGYFGETQVINEPRGPKYMCTKCGDLFNTRLSFLTHSYIHRQLFCIVCGTYMDNSSEMNTHKLVFHSQLINSDPLPVEYQAIFLNDTANKRIESNNLKTNQINIDLKANKNCPLKECPQVKSYPAKSAVKKLKNTINSPVKTVKSRFGRAITFKVKDF